MHHLFYELGIPGVYGFFATFLIPILFLILLSAIKVPYRGSRMLEWQHVVKDFNTPTNEFYERMKQRIKAHNIPKLRGMSIVLRREGNWFSKRRRYLRVGFGFFRVYICAGHFGKSNFFSRRITTKISLLRWILLKLPIVNILFGRFNTRESFYRLDARYSALTLIHDCVIEEIKRLTEAAGVPVPKGIEVKPELESIHGRREGVV